MSFSHPSDLQLTFLLFFIQKASATRRPRQQARTRPASNYIADTQQKHVEFSNSVVGSVKQQQQKKNVSKLFSPDVWKIMENRRATRKLPKECNQWPRAKYLDESDSDSDPETNVDSLYDNEHFGNDDSETFGESEFEVEPDVNNSIEALQTDLNRITKTYVHKVKTEIDEVISKMKLRDCAKCRPKLKTLIQNRSKERGGGDKKSQETLSMLKKAEKEKQECYRKIGAILLRMKEIDLVTEEFLKNQCE